MQIIFKLQLLYQSDCILTRVFVYIDPQENYIVINKLRKPLLVSGVVGSSNLHSIDKVFYFILSDYKIVIFCKSTVFSILRFCKIIHSFL